MPSTPPIEHQADAGRFVQQHGEVQALLTYRRDGDLIDFTHTNVPPSLGGQGIAGRIVKAGLDYAREAGLRVRPSCSYVRHYIKKHPEYADLVD